MMKDVHIEEDHLDRVQAIISSMNKKERARPGIIDISRRKRIAAGSGTKMDEVGQLVKQFDMISKLTKEMSGSSMKDRVKAVKEMSAKGDGIGGMVPGLKGMPGLTTRGSTHMASPKDKFKKRRK